MADILGQCNPNEHLKIEVFKKYKCNLPSFGMLGNTERLTKVEAKDMHTILQNASKPAAWLFWTLIKARNPQTNIALLIPKDKAEASKISRAYKELHEEEVIKRIKRGKYLINPKAFIPTNDQFDTVLYIWDSLS